MVLFLYSGGTLNASNLRTFSDRFMSNSVSLIPTKLRSAVELSSELKTEQWQRICKTESSF